MSALISLILCFVMVFTGGALAESAGEPNAAAVIVSNISVVIDDQVYPLDPALRLGFQQEGDGALIDFALPLDGEDLFPVQARISEDGAAVVLGHSDTEYVFSAEMFEQTAEATQQLPKEVVDSYMNLLNVAMNTNVKNPDLAQREMIAQKVKELIGDVETQEATFTLIDGDESRKETGERYSFLLDNAQLIELTEYIYDSVNPDLLPAYWDFMGKVIAASGEEELQNVDSFETLFAQANIEMTLTGEIIENETCGVADMVFAISGQDDDGEPQSFELPMHVSVFDAQGNRAQVTMDMDSEELPIAMSMVAEVNDTASNVAMSMGVEGVMMVMYANDDGAGQGDWTFAFNEEEDNVNVTIQANYENALTDEPQGSVGFSVAVPEANIDLAFTFDFAIHHELLNDRVGQASKTVVISGEEDISESGLLISAMAMLSDVEKLENNESVANLIAGVQQMIDNMQADYDYDYDEEYEYDDYEYDFGMDDPEDLSFVIPELNGLPDGYALSEAYYDADIDIAYLVYTLNGVDEEDVDGALYVNISASGDEQYTIDLNGNLIDRNESTIQVYQDAEIGYTNANATINGLDISLSGDGDLTNEQIAAFFSGIEFIEAE
ncbi:MAG: hypothetical protein IJ074_04230 [Clostridia bacterium]|nr:hypothetical protein [Clostridia bacterium]